jgi:hypothetical protein
MLNDLGFMKKPKGLIICGYPGIGKTSISGYRKCIDLESSDFKKDDKSWIEQYCWMALRLASQGFTVLTSTHRDVIEYFKISKTMFDKLNVAGPVIFCPPSLMEDEWKNRLKKRCDTDPSGKNQRAFDRAALHWRDDISYLFNCGLPVIYPEAIDYDLRNYIYYIQNKYLGEEYKDFEETFWDTIREGYGIFFEESLEKSMHIALRKSQMKADVYIPYVCLFETNLDRNYVLKQGLLDGKKKFDQELTKRFENHERVKE